MAGNDDKEEFLNAEDFQRGLLALDKAMGTDPWIIAFAPIRIISAGGFLAVSYLKHRDSTGDIDYLIDPEFAKDKDVQDALQRAILSVARELDFSKDWINESMGIFVTGEARESLFTRAEEQNIVLFKGDNLEILAAPLEWALERKLRRIYASDRGRKAELDMTDAVALLDALRERNDGPLDMESVRRMNANGFDVLPDIRIMEKVAGEYQAKYNREIFK
ncbi:hypothetical protein N7488_007546 [Penicillium malachiteum]|nr:hypothetical protein N7488_007546 [Penicillium malachiteum]